LRPFPWSSAASGWGEKGDGLLVVVVLVGVEPRDRDENGRHEEEDEDILGGRPVLVDLGEGVLIVKGVVGAILVLVSLSSCLKIRKIFWGDVLHLPLTLPCWKVTCGTIKQKDEANVRLLLSPSGLPPKRRGLEGWKPGASPIIGHS